MKVHVFYNLGQRAFVYESDDPPFVIKSLCTLNRSDGNDRNATTWGEETACDSLSEALDYAKQLPWHLTQLSNCLDFEVSEIDVSPWLDAILEAAKDEKESVLRVIRCVCEMRRSRICADEKETIFRINNCQRPTAAESKRHALALSKATALGYVKKCRVICNGALDYHYLPCLKGRADGCSRFFKSGNIRAAAG